MISTASRIDRYLTREILFPLLVSAGSVALAVFLFQARRLSTAALGLGLTLEDAAVIFISALPPFLMLAIPIAYLLSVLVGLGRLAGDREITALGSAGMSPLRIARVPLAGGVIVSLAALPIAVFGEPYGLRALHDRLVDVGLRNLTRAITPGVFNEDFRGSAIYARNADESGRLEDVLLYDERDPEHAVLLAARSGAVESKEGASIVFRLDQGEMHMSVAPNVEKYDRVAFEHADLGLDAEYEIWRRTQFVSEIGRMTMTDMRVEARLREKEDPTLSRRIEKLYWRRLAFPSMAFVLGVVGAAIALTGGPRARARNAILGMLSVVGYYLLTRIGDFLVIQYPGTAFLSAWIPNFVVLALGGAALMRAGRPR